MTTKRNVQEFRRRHNLKCGEINQSGLIELVKYNKDTGLFNWVVAWAGGVCAGDKFGALDSRGYMSATINCKRTTLHRLAFLYMTGEIPEEVDHINHIRDDNRWDNLRGVTHKENIRNSRLGVNNKSGVNGVHFDNVNKRWRATIRVNYKVIHLGRFCSIDDAAKARKEAETTYGFHENHGKQH